MHVLRSVCGLLLLLAFVLPASAETWPRFRGPNGAGGIAAELPDSFDADAPKWKTELPGVGHGSPVVWNDRIFLICADPKTEERRPVCVRVSDGKILWTKKVAEKVTKTHKFNGPASSTPAVDATHVYVAWGTKTHQILAAYTHDGEPVWRRELDPVTEGHGFAASPVVYRDMVILNRDQRDEGHWIALDAATGKTHWKLERASKRLSYSTAVVFDPPGRDPELVVTNWQHGFTGINPQTGEVVWEKSVFDTNTNERAISSPVVAGDLIIGTCGFTTNPKHCVAVRPGRNGGVEEVWRVEKSVPHIPSPIVHGDHVFLWEDKGIVSCLEHATGKLVWRERVRGDLSGSPVRAGDKLYVFNRDGQVVCIAASPTFAELGRTELNELGRTTPALADGVLYVRTPTTLWALEK